MTKEEALNILIKDSNTNQISDGYHTFGELYDHRIILFISLCHLYDRYYAVPVWKSKVHSDGSSYEGWFILGIGTEKGKQISYHLPIDKWDLCNVKEYTKAPEWDGHQSNDVLERLMNL